jgi:hypothetical protein
MIGLPQLQWLPNNFDYYCSFSCMAIAKYLLVLPKVKYQLIYKDSWNCNYTIWSILKDQIHLLFKFPIDVKSGYHICKTR